MNPLKVRMEFVLEEQAKSNPQNGSHGDKTGFTIFRHRTV